MFTLVYNLICLIDPDLESKKRYSITLLIGYLLYELMRVYMPLKYKDLMYWIIALDIILLGVSVTKEKNIKLFDYLQTDVINYKF